MARAAGTPTGRALQARPLAGGVARQYVSHQSGERPRPQAGQAQEDARMATEGGVAQDHDPSRHAPARNNNRSPPILPHRLAIANVI